MKKTDKIDMATGKATPKPKPKPKKAQIVAGKAVKTPKTNAGIEREFRRKLQEFSTACNRSLSWWLKSKFTAGNADKNLSKSLEKEFKRLSEYWIQKADELGCAYLPKMLNKIGKSADLAFLAAGVDFDIKRKTQALKSEMEAQIRENLALIQSIPRESIRRYESALYSWAAQYDRQALTEQIAAINAELETNAQISLRRCKMIARDQTAKAVNAYSRARAQSLGFEYYQWVSAHDERVSTGYGGHKQLNGRYYRLDTPTAIIDSYGHVGHPAKRPNCRCTQACIFLMPNEKMELVHDSAAGDYYKLVKTDDEN